MATDSQRPRGQGGALSSLNMAIDALNLAKEVSSVTPAKAVFGTVSVLLTMIKDSMVNELDYVELGLSCADICKALERGMNEKKLSNLNQSVCDAINQLTTTVAEIQRKVIKQGGRHRVSRFLHARNDKDVIAAWKSDLNRILHVFNTELGMNTHTMVSDLHQNMLKVREDAESQNRTTRDSVPGESPPPPPRIFFGRDDLIEEITSFAENLTPIALIGVGGIGKTSIALTILHNDRIERRFGVNRRFIRCDQFPASTTHFLRRLSAVIGAGVEDPEDLAPLRPFLSSKEMFIILDNAESILDPRGPNAKEIYAVVEELGHLNNICLRITSRISAIPSNCETIDIPTLSMEAARDTFYRIYKRDERSDSVNNILKQLDFHPLSITLLATVAHQNRWGADRLTREWENRRTGVLETEHGGGLAATIDLSLNSLMFQTLGPDARGLLEVIAFFPQGVDENNLDWLFPTVPDRTNIFDKFCILSLTYRNNGFVTMLAPLRDYLYPKDPISSPLLRSTKERYLIRLSVGVDPNRPGFGEGRWIVPEDVNIEQMLDVFTTIDANSADVWDACANFMNHLYWYKPRLIILGPKIKELPDGHPHKPLCLYRLSQLFNLVGNFMEEKQLLVHALRLYQERGDDDEAALMLRCLSDVHRRLHLFGEGIQLAEEALEIHERLGNPDGQARCLNFLAYLWYGDGQLDAAEKAASRAIDLFPEKGDKFPVCQCHRILGDIHRSKGTTERAIHHYEAALGIASPFNWDSELIWIHQSLAQLFSAQGRFGDAHAHIGHAKSYTVNDPYKLARVTHLHANLLYTQRMPEEAKSEILHAIDVYEKLGAARDLETARELLQWIEEAMQNGTG